VIGYYVHHHGRGHLHRATAIAQELGTEVVGLSSLARPAQWSGGWVSLPEDADGTEMNDPTAGGRLHWVPERHRGLARRMSAVSAWLEDAQPDLVVVDVSVEVALLCRLHGVPVVTTVLPGDRTDPAHRLVHDVARRVVAAWPSQVAGMVEGLDGGDRFVAVGAISRFDGRAVPATPSPGRRVVLLLGGGGTSVREADVARARASSPDWSWTVLGGPGAAWHSDPWADLCAADVVITHAGQNSLAEVAAARRPAVVFPENRPHREQRTTAAVLRRDGRWPAVVVDAFSTDAVGELLDEASRLDGNGWAGWNDGAGARRAAAVIASEAER
jgi:hypothetical protein